MDVPELRELLLEGALTDGADLGVEILGELDRTLLPDGEMLREGALVFRLLDEGVEKLLCDEEEPELREEGLTVVLLSGVEYVRFGCEGADIVPEFRLLGFEYSLLDFGRLYVGELYDFGAALPRCS